MIVVKCSTVLKFHIKVECKCILIFFRDNENYKIDNINPGDHHFAVEQDECVFAFENDTKKFTCLTLDKLNTVQNVESETESSSLESTGMFLKSLLSNK
jgi:hypothetical protein